MEPSRYEHQSTEERLRVLIADDDLLLRKFLYRILETGGYEVLSAGSGEEALEICRKSTPPVDLLVTDYNMPGMNGVELARECAAGRAELPVLYISGDCPGKELHAEATMPRRAFLPKPFRREELLRKCKEMLLVQDDPVFSV
jgi:CheY-like chemotaxis protein